MGLPEIFLSSSATWLQTLLQWDKAAFIVVNTQWISGFGDFIFPILRYPPTWIPLYAFLFIYSVVKFKWKALPWILFAIVCITLTDQISSTFLKNYFDRIRPCDEPSLASIMRLIVSYCPSNGSFTSSHAVNHFGIGTFFFYSFRPYFKKWAWLFFVWAAAICYAQVYVGVHYPGDVLAGAILGYLLGGFVSFFFVKYFNFRRSFKKRIKN